MAISLSVIALSGCSTGYDTANECYSLSQFRKYSFPSFTSFIMNVRSGENSRIDVYLQMPFRSLRYEKSAEGYKASFSITFVIRNSDKKIIQTQELERKIIAKTYEESISSRNDGLMQSFVLKPSEYEIDIISVDHLSQLRYKETKRIEAKRFTDSVVTSSSLLLLDTVIRNNKGHTLRPLFPALFSKMNDSFGIFQELYNVREGDTVKIVESFSKSREQKKEDNSFVYFTPPYRVTENGCGEDIDSLYKQIDSSLVITKNGVKQLIQFYPRPSIGLNKIERKIIVTRNYGADTIRSTDTYFLRDPSLLSSLSFNEIIGAMRYIMREAEYDSITTAKTEDRNVKINHFWDAHGGLQRRKEFELKIREANGLFTERCNGAETPMGIVFIICGVPDFIECRGGLIETWYYNIGERAFPIQFRRENETVAYYTMDPFSVNDTVWQYFVDRWRRK